MNTIAERRIKSKMPPSWSWQHRQRAATARRSSCLPAGGRRPASKQRLKMEKPAAADHVAQVSAAACVADYWRHRCFRCWWMGCSFWHWIAAYLSALFVKAYHWICCLIAVWVTKKHTWVLNTSSLERLHCIHKERWTMNKATLISSEINSDMKRGFGCSDRCVDPTHVPKWIF